MSTAFLVAAMAITAAGDARSQPPRGTPRAHVPLIPHGGAIPPELVKRALEQLGQGQAFPPGFEEQIREKLAKEHPNLDPELRDNTIRRILADPEMRKRLAEMAEQYRGSKKQPSESDFGKLLKDLSGRFPPGEGSGITRPGTRQPVDPEPPVRPREGNQDLPTPPTIEPGALAPLVEPRPGVELPQRPLFPPGDDGIGELGFEPPSFEFKDSPRDRAIKAVTAMWEQNIGPIRETPAVERALIELATHTANIKDSQGNSIWDSLGKEAGDGSALGDFMSDASKGGWSWPDLDLPSFRLGWGRSSTDIGGGSSTSSSSGDSFWPRRGRSSSSGSSGSGSGLNLGIPGLEGSWLPVILLAAILLGALLYWRFWYLKDAHPEAAFDLGGLGNWPIDPRRISTRQDIVVAFEYLSVLICGPSAKMWTHNTIAAALSDLATTHGETAVMLARLYELARYAPIDEPLTTAEVAEARRLVCRLAGLDYE